MLAVKFTWPQPINIHATPKNTTAVRLPLGVMIRNPADGGGGGDSETLGGQNSAYHLSRQNHTGEQAQSTVTGLVSALAALVYTDTTLQTAIDTEVTARINAILNILFLLESKADLVGGFIPTSQIPAVAITEYLGVAEDQAAMLALNGQSGDWCHRTDLNKAFIIIGEDLSDPASWKEWPMPVSPVTSINGQVGVVVLGKGDIGLGNVPNIDATKRENHTGTQAAETITGLAAVALSGSYNDLIDKPSIDTSRTLLYTTPTPKKPITNTTINVVEDLNERFFDANYIISANTLSAGDVYEVEAKILMMRSATVGSQAVVIAPYLNGAVVAPLGTATSSNASANNFFTISVTIRYAVKEVGVSGKIAAAGYLQSGGTSFQLFSAATFQTFDTTHDLSLNVAFRLNAAALAGDDIVIKSAKLYKLNDPS